MKKDEISNSVVKEWFIVAMVDSAGLQFIVMCSNGGFLCAKEVDNDLRCSLGEFCEEGASSQLILALSPKRAMACTMHYMCVGGAAAVSYEYGIKVMCCYVCKASFSMWQPEEGIYVPLAMKFLFIGFSCFLCSGIWLSHFVGEAL